ncbi:FAD-dependent monooxygenase [Pseudochrobactrum asaccharolyticum]|uniref:Putative polyketide hydroxylase n=1 Tax=Pseudochrobactrum asaccharolyticum TaxID=354351 RepID=A0A366DNR6_9HYPH|nr:FAD-dependent monooxygenase [Pseudochrobactrum asaccharolyticum]RBO90934.1 putative polyketide hydroxylase [Pseudochrobactrum asaccharolyticum]
MIDNIIEDVPVLILGGGIVGLSAGLFLQHHRIPFILLERNQDVSPLPRARGFSARTLELFRQVGLQDEIEAIARTAWKQGKFGGARHGGSMLTSASLQLADITKLHALADPSPCELTACPQTIVEPVLRQALEARGGDVRFGWELLQFEQHGEHVTATARDSAGVERTIRASYMFAADGSRSETRRSLGINRHGIEPNRHYLNIFFEADLTQQVAGRTFSQCEISNDDVSGIFLAMNNTTHWSFHLSYDPATAKPEQWSDQHLTHLIKSAIGADVPIKIHANSPWNTRVRVADKYRDGCIFLMGDAAHVMPPWGGFNANAGIADAHNLAWKIAHVLKGEDNSTLLDTYEAERRPVAIRNGEQAWLRTDFNARFQIRSDDNTDLFDQLTDYGELQTRYRYGANDTVDSLRAQPGTRFPHAWIEHEGLRRSTLDLFGTSHVSITGPLAARPDGKFTYKAETDFRFIDDAVTWNSLTGLPDEDALSVRPDGFVAY